MCIAEGRHASVRALACARAEVPAEALGYCTARNVQSSEGYAALKPQACVLQISNHLDIPKEAEELEQIAIIKEVVAIGEMFWCKVTDVKPGPDPNKPRIACSIKVVSRL